jgi:hypothetical protein
MSASQTNLLGDEKISIFVPSKYGTGQPIPPDVRDNQIRIVAGKLAENFDGASAEDIASNAKRIVGTFKHGIDGSRRVVDEEVYRVWTAVTATKLGDAKLRAAVVKEACRLRDAVRQECVLYEWGREVHLTESAKHASVPVKFGGLSRTEQEEFALMAWHRVAKAEDLCGALALGGWEYPTSDRPDHSDTHGRTKIAWLGDRVAWCWCSSNPPDESDIRALSPGDLLVMQVSDSKLRVWLRTNERWAGPRDIPLATEARPTTRIAIEFVIALLEGNARLKLQQLLDAEGATARFYREIRDQISAVAKAVPARDQDAHAIAQRLLGRLLFLRFVEEKGWLPHESLLQSWRGHDGNYYRKVLLPLFATLDTPPEARSEATEIPYLNGGLFDSRAEDKGLDIPDELFDPENKRSSILDVLYRYQFTLDEEAAREQVVSVDPAMLGRVLESLTPDQARKAKGVHYTPAPIARTLAIRGILPQLVRRAKARGITGVDEDALKRLCAGDRLALSEASAEALQRELHTLRIADPAVGSGALLVACLEVLLDLEAGCRRVLGGDLRRGSRDWAVAARHFVRECLFGVDISPEAVEVARLRLWLFLAVGEQSPTALPDLGYNLRVGDSLAFDPAEERLANELAKQQSGLRKLEFGNLERALNNALDARKNFAGSAGQSAAQRSEAFRALEEAERELRVVLGAKAGNPGEAPPFAWALHFPEVFHGTNRGFDLVIANPPYVRSSSLSPDIRDQLKQRYRSMQTNNVDLYYAFVERCLRAPLPRDEEDTKRNHLRGLAGREGGVAFILPSFVQTTSAESLRAILAEGGHVERWVDFLGLQVFPTATNYVALLFANAEKRERKSFEAQIVTPKAFAHMRDNPAWLEELSISDVRYSPGGWNVRPATPVIGHDYRPLVELATVQVGIQTSLDSFYLFDVVRPSDDPSLVIVRNSIDDEVVLERASLFPCAKGSRDLHGDQIDEGCYVLWPYHKDGSVMEREALEANFPRAWHYLLANRDLLQRREQGKFNIPLWWRFRRPQGVKCASQEKILVPSMMQQPTAYYDREGRVICTASGKGGGGGWVLQAAKGAQTNLERLAAYLRSAEHLKWLNAHAEPKKGGWWGVDRKTLERCPVPISAL